MVNPNLKEVKFEQALSDRYLAYAMSTIVSRSLPDVRDGLKPVHRRLLYAMHELKLDPKSGFKKCARIVGDVIGKFHPHGEVAVYDALVRMAQFFSSRYPLINGQGNFGSIDGDSQAAMRYTEAKLTEYALLIMKDIESDTVDFKENYDGSDEEPCLMPSLVPNLIANGTEGIAVGMATSIPPHNILELLDAANLLIEKPEASVLDICQIIKGPDFPTGGILIEPGESIVNSYSTGRGSFRLRSKWHKEEMDRGQYRIVITEIPYQVQKRGLIEKLADLYKAKKLPFLDDIEDMSAEDICIVLTPKSRNIEPSAIMESLFKLTELEVKVQLNMNVLNKNSAPVVMNIKQVLESFLEHRKVVVTRRLKYRLNAINNRLEILAGLMIVYLNLDEVIRIIREEDDPKAVMIQKWNLSDMQVESILNTRLRSLRKLEEMEIKKENDQLLAEKGSIEEVLASSNKLAKMIAKELVDARKQLEKASNSGRLTVIEAPPAVAAPKFEAYIEKELLTVTLSEMGWLRAYRGHNVVSTKYKNGDSQKIVLEGDTFDKLVIFSSYGKFYSIAFDKVSRGKSDGDPIRVIFDLEQGEDIISAFIYDENAHLLLAANSGKGFIVEMKEVLAQTKVGKQVLLIDKGEAAICAIKVQQDNFVITLGENRRLLAFKASEIPILRKGKGVILQKLKGCKLKGLAVLEKAEALSSLLPSNSNDINLWKATRASLGRLVFGKTWVD